MASEESKITLAGLKLCEKNPLVNRMFRTQSGLVRVKGGGMLHLCPKGTPDTYGFMNDGRIIAIEYKTPDAFMNKKNSGASEEQIEHLLGIVKAGGLAGIACCNEHVEMIIYGAPVGLEPFLSIPDDREQVELIANDVGS